MKVPENGAVPVEIAAVAEGVKVVFVKLSPKLPLAFTNWIDTLHGFVK